MSIVAIDAGCGSGPAAAGRTTRGGHCCDGRRDRRDNARGAALIEAAVTIPLVLALVVGIFEFGRAFQTWQVLTNAAREGGRMAVIPDADATAVQTRVRAYLTDGYLSNAATATIDVNRNATITVSGAAVSASQVNVDYPFQFMVFQPVIRLLNPSSNTGAPLTMRASVLMRNESQ